jgi:hypothetical protein
MSDSKRPPLTPPTPSGGAPVPSGDTRKAESFEGWGYADTRFVGYGKLDRVPDLVVFPRSHEVVVRIVEAARKHGACVIPFGGGTCPASPRRARSSSPPASRRPSIRATCSAPPTTASTDRWRSPARRSRAHGALTARKSRAAARRS